MFYLIRINRRDKLHSRIGNDNAAKNNSCPGNERANFNFRKKKKNGGEKGTWHLQGEQYKRLQHPDLRARGGGQSATGNQGNNETISQQLSLPFPITDKPA